MHDFDFDIFVIGGGSGGMSCVRWSATGGAKVGLADFVKPSTHGSTWGLGGTCVNVGCIPKKLMHIAGAFGEIRADQQAAGWDVGPHGEHDRHLAFDWKRMKDNVQKHIKTLNWDYKMMCFNQGVTYFNRLGKVVGPHEVELVSVDGTVERKTANSIVVSVGARPNMNSFPGCDEHCISSDDVFLMDRPPGKTLVVGGSVIATEVGGFLTGMG